MANPILELSDYIETPGASTFEACLLLARHADPELNIERYLHLLHAWSVELKSRMDPSANITDQIKMLNQFLYQEKRFHADHDDFYNPDNSLMHRVMERRTGLPVTMSVLYVALGRKIGLDLQGISFPGHFLVLTSVDEGIFVLDPYHNGVSLSEEQLAKLLLHADPDASPERLPEYLEGASITDTLMRIMRSLKTVYYQKNERESALSILNLMLEVDPELLDERRERGLLLSELKCGNNALGDLDHYIKLRPNCSENRKIRSIISDLQRNYSTLH